VTNRSEEHMDTPTLELKIPPLIVVALVGSGMWVASNQLPALSFSFAGLVWLSWTVLVLALGTLTAGVHAFSKARTTVDPRHPESSSAVVANGVYRFTRNPMYLGMLLALLSWALFLSSVAAMLFLPVFVLFINRFQIRPEERALTAKFGEAYVSYLRSVRRWL
jgi:protein-S-isoprenylcysteine O-methyltransferase Ste14